MFDKAKELYKLQREARRIKAELKNTHIESENEGIKVVINGEQEVISIEISAEAMQDQKRLGENLKNCFNKAIKKSQQIGAELMKDVMGGMPGLGQ